MPDVVTATRTRPRLHSPRGVLQFIEQRSHFDTTVHDHRHVDDPIDNFERCRRSRVCERCTIGLFEVLRL